MATLVCPHCTGHKFVADINQFGEIRDVQCVVCGFRYSEEELWRLKGCPLCGP